MPLYFFDINDGGPALDSAAADLPDILAARRQAMTFAADLAKSDDTLTAGGRAIVVTIRNETDTPVATVRLVAQVAAHDL